MHTLLRSLLLLPALLYCASAQGIGRDPNGVNVNSQGATSVFITFGGLNNQVPVEAAWCGELIPATPDIGMRCDPATIYGQLPLRIDQSSLNASATAFTDIMSIPASVARRAWQAAARGENSAFFYVRRFVSTTGGPDEYVFVTCRMAGGGARVPLALLDVQLPFDVDSPVTSITRGAAPPSAVAIIHYNGSGRLIGRWEVVAPGEELPSSRDLLTEATLPPEERPLQRRFQQLERFSVFLPPTGRIVLPGPDPRLIPTSVEGLYHLLLRIEASNDKEGDSNLALAGAGTGVVHGGAVAGFPLPPLRYYVGGAAGVETGTARGLQLIAPAAGASWSTGSALALSWAPLASALLYRIEIADGANNVLLSVLVQQGVAGYQAPDWVPARAPGSALRWRVRALDADGRGLAESEWREIAVPASSAEPITQD